jgi:hypothetical protein
MYCFVKSEVFAIVNVRFFGKIRKLCLPVGDLRDEVEASRQAYVRTVLTVAGYLANCS